MEKLRALTGKCCPGRAKKRILQADWGLSFNQPRLDLPKNKISTGIYSVYNFIPKSLALQFSRAVNIYFLCVGALQIIPQISTTDGVPVIFIPLCLILTFTSIKEIIEDYKRHKSDRLENNKKVMVYKNGSFVEDKWESLHVGQIIQVREDEAIPADILLLNTPLKKGVCYVETKSLDGETNLKTKFVHKDLPQFEVIEELMGDCNLSLKYESPNEYLYKFLGCLKVQESEIAMNEQNFLLRGCLLKNTPHATGVVCYTGHFTKIMLNSTNSKSKLSKLERDMGRQIVYTFLILLAFCAFSAIYSAAWSVTGKSSAVYLDPYGKHPENKNFGKVFILEIGSWLLLLCNAVPISLVVNVEICRLVQSLLISADYGMKYLPTNLSTSVQSPSLTEELGQIEYILSDKTGTLTKNIMDFKKISIAGELYGQKGSFKDIPNFQKVPNVDFFDANIIDDLTNSHMSNHSSVKECMILLATCHTAVVQEKNGEKHYNTTSPDELALVNFAKFTGVEFEGVNESHHMCINFRGKEHLKYKLLQVFEFNSDRKRMSVIVKTPEGKIMLYTKGADTILLDRMIQSNYTNASLITITNHHLHQFAIEGLRTLVLAKRELSNEEYQDWSQKYEVAKTLISGREEEMEKLQSEIEVDYQLIGATGIEDKLQDEVDVTIAKFKEAGMKVWMLTGDKVETAISIGYACQLLDRNMLHFELTEKTYKEVALSLEKMLDSVTMSHKKETRLSLVISGDALIHAIHPDLCPKLILLAKCCQAVIACRVSPKQKQQFVSLIKKNSPKSSTLAIGDGANDVYMITAASVGVGIRGLEGQQAARASDFAIGEFKLLRRLLFYHGRENYRRNSYLILYNFYKNIALVTMYFWFGFFSGFSATPYIEKFLYQLFNTIFTSVPILLFAIIDTEFSPSMLVSKPALYVQGMKNELFNTTKFLRWVWMGIWESAILTLYGIFAFDRNFSDDDNGRFIGLYGPGMFVFSGIVWITNLKVFAMSNSLNFLVFFFIIGSTLVYKLSFLLVSAIKGTNVYGFIDLELSNQTYYVGIAIVVFATLMPTIAYKHHRYFETKGIGKEKIVPIKLNGTVPGIFVENQGLVIEDASKDEESPPPQRKHPLQMSKSSTETMSVVNHDL